MHFHPKHEHDTKLRVLCGGVVRENLMQWTLGVTITVPKLIRRQFFQLERQSLGVLVEGAHSTRRGGEDGICISFIAHKLQAVRNDGASVQHGHSVVMLVAKFLN